MKGSKGTLALIGDLLRRIKLLWESTGFLKSNRQSLPIPVAKVILQDETEDLSVVITTKEFAQDKYITAIITKSGNSFVRDERKTESLEMASLEHNIAVTRLIRKGKTELDFKTPDGLVRPEINRKNSYLEGAVSFTPMLSGTED